MWNRGKKLAIGVGQTGIQVLPSTSSVTLPKLVSLSVFSFVKIKTIP